LASGSTGATDTAFGHPRIRSEERRFLVLSAPWRRLRRAHVTDLSLLLQAPDLRWAERVESLIRRALGEEAGVTIGILGEELAGPSESPAWFLTGIVGCDQPERQILAIITSALAGCDVETRSLDSGRTQLVVCPPRRAR
jgi:hypothetical protein